MSFLAQNAEICFVCFFAEKKGEAILCDMFKGFT